MVKSRVVGSHNLVEALMSAICGKGIRAGWEKCLSHMTFGVGDGMCVSFWHNRGCGNLSLKDVYPELYSCKVDKDALVSNLNGDGCSWNVWFVRLS
jgi:hypothetical protein